MPFFDFFENRFMKHVKEPDFFSKQVVKARRFYMESASQKNRNIRIICGGCEQTSPDFKIDRKDFPYYSVEFVTHGKGSAILDGQKYNLTPGTIFSYGPKISQLITAEGNLTMVKYFVDFSGSSARQTLMKYVTPVGTAINVSRQDEITGIFNDLIRHGLSDSPIKSITCSALLEYLFYRIAELKTNEDIQSTKAFTTYQLCRQFINKNYINIKSLNEISEHCKIDKAYLCRLFKTFDTQSPYQYLMYLKMTRAAQLLQRSSILSKEIAFELGFDDPFHFSRAFKKVFGISPKLFRNR